MAYRRRFSSNVKPDRKRSDGYARQPTLGKRIVIRRILVDQVFSSRYANKYVNSSVPDRFGARRTSDRSLLSLDDRVEQVLDDNETIEIERLNDEEDSLTVATYVSLCFCEKPSPFTDDGFSLIHVAMNTGEYVQTFSKIWKVRKNRFILGHFSGWLPFEMQWPGAFGIRWLSNRSNRW